MRRASEADEARPNILLLMTDQQRWDALGCTGGWVETPNIDRLAAEGVRFSDAYTNAPWCVPARKSLQGGCYPRDIPRWEAGPARRRASWMRTIRDAGYGTCVIGKTHLHPHRGDLRDRVRILNALGLDHVDEIAGPLASANCRSNLTDLWEEAGVWDDYRRDIQDRAETKLWVVRPTPLPFELYPDVYVGQQAVAYLREYDGDKPWYCWVSFSGPHEPWDAPEPYASAYDPDAMPEPVQFAEDPPDRPRGLLDERLAGGGIPFEPGDVSRIRANYAGKVTLIDEQIGEVLRVVEQRGELDRTVVAFVSDHGEMNGDYNLIRKRNFLNPAARVPFIVRLPPGRRAAAGAASDAMVELMDLGPTLVELAGAAPDPGSAARSVVPVLDDPSRPHRDVARSELPLMNEVMVATADWKMVLNAQGEVYLLFDLRADPSETRNLAGRPGHDDVERELRRKLDESLEAGS